MSAACCTTCGSRRLTKAVEVISFRPLTFLLLVGLAVILVPLAIAALGSVVQRVWWSVVDAGLPVLVSLGFASILIALLGGERGSRLVGSFWFGLLKLIVSCIEALARGIGKLFKKKMPHWFKKVIHEDHH